MAHVILRLRQVLQRKGLSRSQTYLEISRGTFAPPIALGARSRGWPEREVDAVIGARIAGKSDEEIRELVARLVADRKAAV